MMLGLTLIDDARRSLWPVVLAAHVATIGGCGDDANMGETESVSGTTSDTGASCGERPDCDCPSLPCLPEYECVDGEWVCDCPCETGPPTTSAETTEGDTCDPTEIVGAAAVGPSSGVTADGNTAYVAAVDTLHVVDISDPTAPSMISSLTMTARSVTLAAGYLYVGQGYVPAMGSDGFEVVDISDPQDPTSVAVLDTPGRTTDIAISGNWAFLADDIGLQVVNVLDPTMPVLEAALDTPGGARGVHIDGTHVYIADDETPFGDPTGLVVFDVSDPGAPNEVAVLGWEDSEARDVVVIDDVAFVANAFLGIVAVDVATPASPEVIGMLEIPGIATAVDAREGCLVVADGEGVNANPPVGFQVVDITDPANMVLTTSIDMPGQGSGIALTPTHALVAAAGLQVVGLECCAMQ